MIAERTFNAEGWILYNAWTARACLASGLTGVAAAAALCVVLFVCFSLERMIEDKSGFAANIISRRQDEFEALKKAR